MRRHKLLVVICAMLAVAAATAYVSQRSATYKASAEILVNPLPAQDTTYRGLPFIRDFGEASRTIQTAAALVESPAAANLTAERLGPGWSAGRVNDTIDVQPLGESTVLQVTAETTGAELAARAANTFAQSALDVRRSVVTRQVNSALGRLRSQQASLSDSASARDIAAELASQISALEGVRDDDPTLSFSERAAVPTSPLGAPAWLVIVMALIAGVAVGTGAALVREMTERSVRDEFDVLSILPAPVFARSPDFKRRRGRSVTQMPPGVVEAFRTLRIRLEQEGEGRAILMTSATSGDGKTTSSINLALSLIGAGHRVLLMDFDLRKPDVGRQLGLRLERGLAATLTGTPLAELVTTAPEMPLLKVIPAATSDADVVLLESLRRRMPAILQEARGMADYVVIDSAPLGEVADALTVAQEVDDVVLVVRTGHTNRRNLEVVRDLLGSVDRDPAGLLLVGDSTGLANSYYLYGAREGRRTASTGA